jgi:hypothetical protein
MKTKYTFLFYFVHFFLEWEILLTKFVDKIETHFMFNNLFSKIWPLWDNVEKYGTAR